MATNPSVLKLPFFALVLLLAGCGHQNPYQKGDHFQLEREGATLPVQVAGNVRSGIFLVMIHGGPGGSSAFYTRHEAFQNLQKDCAVVYWDQRQSGMASGTPTESSLNLDGFVTDLDMLIDDLRQRYPIKRLVLLGHSWGGALGTAYLLDEKRQAKVDAWIEMNGAHDTLRALELSRLWVLKYARQQVAKAESDAPDWQEAIEWYSDHKVIHLKAFKVHLSYVKKANGYFHDPALDDAQVHYVLEMLFEKPAAAFTIFRNGDKLATQLEIDRLSLTSQMHQITLPSLFLWGRFDGLLPIESGREGFSALGTEASKKEFVTFENSGHILFSEEPQRFEKVVRRFVLDK